MTRSLSLTDKLHLRVRRGRLEHDNSQPRLMRLSSPKWYRMHGRNVGHLLYWMPANQYSQIKSKYRTNHLHVYPIVAQCTERLDRAVLQLLAVVQDHLAAVHQQTCTQSKLSADATYTP
jgi:hypothetical protein